MPSLAREMTRFAELLVVGVNWMLATSDQRCIADRNACFSVALQLEALSKVTVRFAPVPATDAPHFASSLKEV